MKQHITRAQARQMFGTIIFCDEITNIAALCGLRPEYYNAGGFGWNWDIYNLDGVAVVGGYRNYPRCSARVDYSDAQKIQKHVRCLKTPRGKQAAAIRLIKKFAKL